MTHDVSNRGLTRDDVVRAYETIRDSWRYSDERCQRQQEKTLRSLLEGLGDAGLAARIDGLRRAIAVHIDPIARTNRRYGYVHAAESRTTEGRHR
jgi:hypothetical protein